MLKSNLVSIAASGFKTIGNSFRYQFSAITTCFIELTIHIEPQWPKKSDSIHHTDKLLREPSNRQISLLVLTPV